MSYNLKGYDLWKTDYPEDDPEYEFENDAPDYDDMLAYDMVNSSVNGHEYGYERM